ncbi:MAG: insulinase family protein [Minicystis sp.]
MKRAALLLAVVIMAACAADPPAPPITPPAAPPSAPTAVAPAKPRESPPPPAPPVAFHLPEARWSTLPNGVALGVVTVRGLPIVEARVLVRGGRAAEGDRPGSAEILAEVVKASVDVAPLGGDFSIEAGDDAFELRLAVTSDAVEHALAQIGAALRAPKMAAAEVKRIQKRLVGEAADRLVEDGEALAEQMLRRILFATASGAHPYARAFAMPEELSRVGAPDLAALHARAFTGPSTTIVLAGDIDADAARGVVAKTFGGLPAKAASIPAPPQTTPPAARRVVVVHRPKAERSDIWIGALAPPPRDPAFAACSLVQRILGHKGTGRLFMTVRETASLVYAIRSDIVELGSGPVDRALLRHHADAEDGARGGGDGGGDGAPRPRSADRGGGPRRAQRPPRRPRRPDVEGRRRRRRDRAPAPLRPACRCARAARRGAGEPRPGGRARRRRAGAGPGA